MKGINQISLCYTKKCIPNIEKNMIQSKIKRHTLDVYIFQNHLHSKDTLEIIDNKIIYTPHKLIKQEEYYYGYDTLITKYTYDDSNRLISVINSSESYTIYDYKDNLKHTQAEYTNNSILRSKTYYNLNEQPINIDTYNDTSAIVATQKLFYDTNGLITQVENYGFLETTWVRDTSSFDMISNDTIFSLTDKEQINYNISPEKLYFKYEYYK